MTTFSRGKARIARTGALVAALMLLTTLPPLVQAESVLKQITHNPLPGGDVEIVLHLDGAVSEPSSFSIDDPARVAIDLPETRSDLNSRSVTIGSGAARNVTIVEAGGRTRVVVNLFRAVPYDVRVAGNRVIVTLGDTGPTGLSVADTSDVVMLESERATLNNVDFRRGMEGEAQILVDLTSSGGGVDIRQEPGKLIVELYNVAVPPALEQRLDVMDFATPVKFVDSFSDGQNARIDITIVGEYEHFAYQAGGELVIEVRELGVEEEETMLAEEEAYSGDPVTFNFQNIEIRAVLQLLADLTGLNMVVSDSVQGNITLRLVNVPWDQAFDVVLRTKGLDKRQTGNVVWVAPASVIAEREKAERLNSQEVEQLAPLIGATIRLNYAKAADVSSLLNEEQFISTRGSVSVDERTNTLIISETAAKIQEIRDLVVVLDVAVEQVLIESRIVIATQDFSRELGVRLGFTSAYEDSNGNIYTTSGTLAATDDLGNQAAFNRINGNPTFPLIVPGPPGSGLTVPNLGNRLNVNLPAPDAVGFLAFGILGDNYLLDLEISAAEKEGRGEVISTPRVITANQQTAVIEQGVEIPFQQATSSGATAVSFKKAVLSLTVTPLITPDNRIILDLDVHQDSVGEVVPTGSGGVVPSIDTRQVQTQVLVDDGDTVVLGGILEHRRTETEQRVPYLGSLPVIGGLFRSRLIENDKAELLIFVTPRILRDNLGAAEAN